MRIRRVGATLAAASVLITALAACGGGQSTQSYPTVVEKIQGAKQVVVGTKWDQPSLGLKTGAQPEGYDVDVAKYVIKDMAGGQDVKIDFKESASSNREAFLENGTVDIIFATYSITEARKQKVTYGGPYIVAHQDTMVRANDTTINKATELANKRICQVAGSNSYKRITDPPPDGQLGLPAQLVGAANYSECAQKLAGNNLDAVTTDDLILAGFDKQAGGKFKILGDPFTNEQYGVGLKKGDAKTCEAVNAAITKMYADGTAKQLYDKWFSTAKGLTPPSATAPQYVGCA
jgi:glutamate transport system substrate-binding protein